MTGMGSGAMSRALVRAEWTVPLSPRARCEATVPPSCEGDEVAEEKGWTSSNGEMGHRNGMFLTSLARYGSSALQSRFSIFSVSIRVTFHCSFPSPLRSLTHTPRPTPGVPACQHERGH
jgi:hypothetical protein